MDYKKVIEDFQDILDLAEYRIKNGDVRTFAYIPKDKLDDLKTAISAMLELHAIHDNGISLEHLKDIDFRKSVVEHINYDAYMSLMDELEKYRGIGTLEEVEEAVEKRKAKRISMHVNESDLKVGSVIFRKGTKSYKCQCNRLLTKAYKFCPECGQLIDWKL